MTSGLAIGRFVRISDVRATRSECPMLLKSVVQTAKSPLAKDPKQGMEHIMNNWPHSLPDDLAKAFAELDGMRFTASDADRWSVIREWLKKHGVPAPDYALPTPPEITRQD